MSTASAKIRCIKKGDLPNYRNCIKKGDLPNYRNCYQLKRLKS